MPVDITLLALITVLIYILGVEVIRYLKHRIK